MQRDWSTSMITLYCSAWKWSEDDAQNKFEYHIGGFYPKLPKKMWRLYRFFMSVYVIYL